MSKKSRPWSRQQRRAIRRRTQVAQIVAMRMRHINGFFELQAKCIEAERQAVAILFGAAP